MVRIIGRIDEGTVREFRAGASASEWDFCRVGSRTAAEMSKTLGTDNSGAETRGGNNVAVIAQRPGFGDAEQKQSEHHISWFPGQEATPIGTHQRTALVRSPEQRGPASLRKTMLAVSILGLAIVVAGSVELPRLGVEQIIQFGFGLLGLVVLGVAGTGIAAVVRSKRPRHAKPGRLNRLLRGGGAHV
jgi:hypothetical protein